LTYFVLRSEKRLFPRFVGQPCEIELVTTSGPWALYRKLPATCHAPGAWVPRGATPGSE
jgi:hypothetical protein